MHQRQQLHLRAFTLVPRFEQETADARLHTVEAVDLKRRVVLGERLEDIDELVGVGAQIIEVGRLRRVGNHKNHALIFIRGQLVLGEQQKHRYQAQHDDREHQYHRAGVEGGMQKVLVTHL
ncbi:hypothetical protein D3C84_788610 [compost metagenome]